MNLPRFSVKNPVAVNLLMWAIIIGGIYCWFTLVREFFPNFASEKFIVSVTYPGATPDEVEKLVALRIEREIEDVDNIEEIETQVLEGAMAMVVTLEEEADRNKVLNDLRTEIDKVKPELPEEAEDPEITEQRPFIPVISVILYGDVSEKKLKEEARQVRDDLSDSPEISEILMAGIRKNEIWIEVEPHKLEEHEITFQEVGQKVAANNLDLPGGELSNVLGNIRVRTLGEEKKATALEKIIIRGNHKGASIKVSDVARVRETFEDKVQKAWFQGKRAIILTIFKTPEQDALKISSLVKKYLKERPTRMGGAIKVDYINDLSRFIDQRLQLMIRNARAGIILVVIALAFFLNIRIAFWVSIGIPTAFLGTFIVMKLTGLSINLLSLFALIVVLGIIVDDAIVVGEQIFTKMERGMSPGRAAVEGAREMMGPVTAAVLTSIVAFAPLAFIEGQIGAFLGVLPKIVIAALSVSLIEAFIILPAHLGHIKNPFREDDTQRDSPVSRKKRWWRRFGDWKANFLSKTLPDRFEKILRYSLRWRYVSLAFLMAFSLAVFGLVASQIVPFVFLQNVDSENINVNLEMAPGTREEKTIKVIRKLEDIILNYREVKTAFSVVGTSFSQEGQERAADPATIGQINVQLLPAEEREARGLRTSQQLTNDMSREVGTLPGVKKLQFKAQSGGPGGADIEVLIRGDKLAKLIEVKDWARQELATYQGVLNIEDNLNQGKREVRLRLKPAARHFDLSTRDLALQVRHALFGFEAQDLQEEDEEVTIRVLLPEATRKDVSHLTSLKVQTPSGHRVPLGEVATLSTARGYGSLTRVDGRRAISVKADVDQQIANSTQITADFSLRLKKYLKDYPGVKVTFEGRKKETRESLSSLAVGFPAALLFIFVIIAIVFRSYFQPILIMMVIPFSIVGSILGHLIMGFPLTILSLIGVVALAGIVVNDSLILVDLVNRLRREGMSLFESVVQGARGRLRAILLTSVTTVFGLAPLMLERSFQAQFLIPLAISIVFGLAFATVITLVIIPLTYLIMEDIWTLLNWLWTGRWERRDLKENYLEEPEEETF